MFTGIVQGLGEISALQQAGGNGLDLKVRLLFDVPHIVLGESIAVNGLCLTVNSLGERWFGAYASGETLACSTMGNLRVGARVNIERALALGERLGGHLVSGHVDVVATVAERENRGESLGFRLQFPEKWGNQVVPKGSVCLDGLSLTVNHCGPDFLEVNVIPETARVSTVSEWAKGRRVNMETDMLVKYVQHLLGPVLVGTGLAGSALLSSQNPSVSKIDRNFLQEHGFI